MKRINAWMLTILASVALAGCEPQGRPRYTVLLERIYSPEYHVEWAEHRKEMTEQDTDWPDLRIVHGSGVSEVFCGHYVTLAQAERQLSRARRYRLPNDRPVYNDPKIIPLPPHKVGPPEYDLESAEGHWTLVIGEFNDLVDAPGHEEAAVAYCMELREQGHRAYYWNKPLKSYVAVGLFPEASYHYVYEAGRVTGPFILDKRLAELRETFPDLAVNGRQELRRYFDTTTNQYERSPAPSYVEMVPGALGDDETDDPAGEW
ncbi:MAG: hypothetical protein ACYTFO_02405 [Planctomycetota bacterium]|jgi:hypothetical protein